MPLLCVRGYQPIEFSSVMFPPLAGRAMNTPGGRVTARRAGEADMEIRAQPLPRDGKA